ncbi:Hypothetical predicted protein [Pelobates cultripes]|uniref:Uncharacterized protein n=1 Tax=Pelobates cultripes TaxID=61616 RepID=A0AAD1WL25_PELCU|nr:Hypothetical predicted protein [Pelobates cultripes]
MAPWRLSDHLLLLLTKLEEGITSFFDLNSTPDTSVTTQWQAHKAVVRGLLISQASHLDKKSRQEYIDLLRSLREETLKQTRAPTSFTQQRIDDLRKELNNKHLRATALITYKLK